VILERRGRLERLQDAEQFADAADEQPLLLDLDPDAGARRGRSGGPGRDPAP